jgi:hypothetical protein
MFSESEFDIIKLVSSTKRIGKALHFTSQDRSFIQNKKQ